ncbi:MAG: PAS domain-containing protein [Actinomycetes bacterium]
MIDQVQERRAGFFLVDEAGVVVQANDRARDLIRAQGDLVGRRITPLIPQWDDEDDQRISTLRCDDGTDLPIFIAKVPLGEHLGVGIVDLTDPAAVHDAFVPNNTVAGRLIAHLDTGIVVQGADGAILAANAAAARILDLSMDALLGRTSIDPRWRTIREDLSDLPGEEHPAMRCLRSGEPVHAVFGVHTPGDELRWIDVHAIPLVEHRGAVIAVATSFVDISAEHGAATAARDSLERIELLLAETADAVLVTDAGGTITYAAPSTHATLGRDAATVLGCPVADLGAGSSGPSIARLLEDASARAGHRVGGTVEVEVPGNGDRWFEIRVRNHLEVPAIGGLVITLSDVHDRVQAIEQLRRVNAELERRLAELDEEHRVDREMGLATDLLAHCASADEARSVVWGAVTSVFRGVSANLMCTVPPSTTLSTVESTAGTGDEFDVDDCWALRTHRVHRSDGAGGLRCHHTGEGGDAICVPLGLATAPFGLIVLQAGDEATLRHAHALADRVGPLLQRPDVVPMF